MRQRSEGIRKRETNRERLNEKIRWTLTERENRSVICGYETKEG